MLAAAAGEPDRLVVGVDASAAAMAEASRRAGRRPERGGLPNALFVVAAAGVGPIDRRALDALAGAYQGHGLTLTRVRPATPADVAASRSSWGRRLGAGTRRPAWRLEATRVPAAVS